MKVLWIHNFSPCVKNSGVFMHSFYEDLSQFSSDLHISLYYTGDLKNFFNYLSYIKNIQKVSKSFDIVHVQYGSLLGLLVAISLFNTKETIKVLSLRGSDWYFMKNKSALKRLHSLLSVSFTRLSIPFFDAIFPVSNRMEKSIGSDKSYTVISPFNSLLFYIDREIYKAEFHNGKRVCKLLFASISVNNEIKNYSLLKNSVDLLNKNNSSLFYKIVSASDFHNSDMRSVYNSVDLICLTSHYEGWPNVIKEALSCGLPFVSTDVSDLKYIADKFPKTCFISDPNPVDFAKNILSATRTPISDATREMLRNEIISLCELDISREKIIQTYKNLISTKQRCDPHA